MRTKMLIGAAATMVAGILSASAQVYSVNVVGYVNAVANGAGAFTLLANPLDDGTNTVTSLGSALPNKSSVQIWNGSGFNLATKTNGAWTANLSIPPGTGFFVKTPAASGSITNTFVGNVIVAPGGGQTNKALTPGLALVGSPVPFAGNLNDAYGTNSLNLGAQLPNKSSVQVWNGSSFSLSTKTNGAWTVNFSLGVAQGFFVNAKSATNWTQTLQ